ncbi:MAG: NADH-quinone oxidoreductase subunit M, partial [Proteobacteria bacterium]|nr:NADH-quinone oxidoreductase subunit M [Pseudomonadota bacterium]
MASLHILSVIVFLPLAGVVAILLLYLVDDEKAVAKNARYVALWASLATFFVSVLMWMQFDSTRADFQFVEKAVWIKSFGISYHIGVDGISLFFVLLSTFLTPICILSSWDAIKTHVREYMIAFLALETFMVGMFCSLDMVLFYIFFEGVLIPMFLIIGIWGGPRRVYAA